MRKVPEKDPVNQLCRSFSIVRLNHSESRFPSFCSLYVHTFPPDDTEVHTQFRSELIDIISKIPNSENVKDTDEIIKMDPKNRSPNAFCGKYLSPHPFYVAKNRGFATLLIENFTGDSTAKLFDEVFDDSANDIHQDGSGYLCPIAPSNIGYLCPISPSNVGYLFRAINVIPICRYQDYVQSRRNYDRLTDRIGHCLVTNKINKGFINVGKIGDPVQSPCVNLAKILIFEASLETEMSRDGSENIDGLRDAESDNLLIQYILYPHVQFTPKSDAPLSSKIKNRSYEAGFNLDKVPLYDPNGFLSILTEIRVEPKGGTVARASLLDTSNRLSDQDLIYSNLPSQIFAGDEDLVNNLILFHRLARPRNVDDSSRKIKRSFLSSNSRFEKRGRKEDGHVVSHETIEYANFYRELFISQSQSISIENKDDLFAPTFELFDAQLISKSRHLDSVIDQSAFFAKFLDAASIRLELTFSLFCREENSQGLNVSDKILLQNFVAHLKTSYYPYATTAAFDNDDSDVAYRGSDAVKGKSGGNILNREYFVKYLKKDGALLILHILSERCFGQKVFKVLCAWHDGKTFAENRTKTGGVENAARSYYACDFTNKNFQEIINYDPFIHLSSLSQSHSEIPILSILFNLTLIHRCYLKAFTVSIQYCLTYDIQVDKVDIDFCMEFICEERLMELDVSDYYRNSACLTRTCPHSFFKLEFAGMIDSIFKTIASSPHYRFLKAGNRSLAKCESNYSASNVVDDNHHPLEESWSYDDHRSNRAIREMIAHKPFFVHLALSVRRRCNAGRNVGGDVETFPFIEIPACLRDLSALVNPENSHEILFSQRNSKVTLDITYLYPTYESEKRDKCLPSRSSLPSSTRISFSDYSTDDSFSRSVLTRNIIKVVETFQISPIVTLESRDAASNTKKEKYADRRKRVRKKEERRRVRRNARKIEAETKTEINTVRTYIAREGRHFWNCFMKRVHWYVQDAAMINGYLDPIPDLLRDRSNNNNMPSIERVDIRIDHLEKGLEMIEKFFKHKIPNSETSSYSSSSSSYSSFPLTDDNDGSSLPKKSKSSKNVSSSASLASSSTSFSTFSEQKSFSSFTNDDSSGDSLHSISHALDRIYKRESRAFKLWFVHNLLYRSSDHVQRRDRMENRENNGNESRADHMFKRQFPLLFVRDYERSLELFVDSLSHDTSLPFLDFPGKPCSFAKLVPVFIEDPPEQRPFHERQRHDPTRNEDIGEKTNSLPLTFLVGILSSNTEWQTLAISRKFSKSSSDLIGINLPVNSKESGLGLKALSLSIVSDGVNQNGIIHIPNFSIIVRITVERCVVYMHMSPLENSNERAYNNNLSLYRRLVAKIKLNFEKVNCRLLLENLFQTRIANILLIPDRRHDLIFDQERRHYNNPYAIVPSFAQGRFSCRLVWRYALSLQPRLSPYTSPPHHAFGPALRLLGSAVLDKFFGVLNRPGYYVFRESDDYSAGNERNSRRHFDSGNSVNSVISGFDSSQMLGEDYVMDTGGEIDDDDDDEANNLDAEGMATVESKGDDAMAIRTNEGGRMVEVGAENADAAVGDGGKSPQNFENVKGGSNNIFYFNLTPATTKDILGDYGSDGSVQMPTDFRFDNRYHDEFLILNFYGLSQPGDQIKKDFIKVLENRLDEAVTDILWVTINRNPKHKLFPYDASFLKHPHDKPRLYFKLPIPAYVHQPRDNIPKFLYYLSQHLLTFCISPNLPDHFFNLFADDRLLRKRPILTHGSSWKNIFLFTKPYNTGKKAISFVQIFLPPNLFDHEHRDGSPAIQEDDKCLVEYGIWERVLSNATRLRGLKKLLKICHALAIREVEFESLLMTRSPDIISRDTPDSSFLARCLATINRMAFEIADCKKTFNICSSVSANERERESINSNKSDKISKSQIRNLTSMATSALMYEWSDLVDNIRFRNEFVEDLYKFLRSLLPPSHDDAKSPDHRDSIIENNHGGGIKLVAFGAKSFKFDREIFCGLREADEYTSFGGSEDISERNEGNIFALVDAETLNSEISDRSPYLNEIENEAYLLVWCDTHDAAAKMASYPNVSDEDHDRQSLFSPKFSPSDDTSADQSYGDIFFRFPDANFVEYRQFDPSTNIDIENESLNIDDNLIKTKQDFMATRSLFSCLLIQRDKCSLFCYNFRETLIEDVLVKYLHHSVESIRNKWAALNCVLYQKLGYRYAPLCSPAKILCGSSTITKESEHQIVYPNAKAHLRTFQMSRNSEEFKKTASQMLKQICSAFNNGSISKEHLPVATFIDYHSLNKCLLEFLDSLVSLQNKGLFDEILCQVFDEFSGYSHFMAKAAPLNPSAIFDECHLGKSRNTENSAALDSFELEFLRANRKDFLQEQGIQYLKALKAQLIDTKEKSIVKYLYRRWSSADSDTSTAHFSLHLSTLNILKRRSRSFHYCATPILFDPSWRKEVSKTRSADVQTDTATPPQIMPSHDWVNLYKSFMKEYLFYLQTLGFNHVSSLQGHPTSSAPHGVGDQRKGNDCHSSFPRVFMQKTIPEGGILLLELSLDMPFFVLYFYVCLMPNPFEFSARNDANGTTGEENSVSKDDLGNKQDKINSFLEICENYKVLCHLHSFSYDFHLRIIYNHLYPDRSPNDSGDSLNAEHNGGGDTDGEPLNLLPLHFNLVPMLSDFVNYYNKAPGFSQNLVIRKNLEISCRREFSSNFMRFLLNEYSRPPPNAFRNATPNNDSHENADPPLLSSYIHSKTHRKWRNRVPYLYSSTLGPVDPNHLSPFRILAIIFESENYDVLENAEALAIKRRYTDSPQIFSSRKTKDGYGDSLTVDGSLDDIDLSDKRFKPIEAIFNSGFPGGTKFDHPNKTRKNIAKNKASDDEFPFHDASKNLEVGEKNSVPKRFGVYLLLINRHNKFPNVNTESQTGNFVTVVTKGRQPVPAAILLARTLELLAGKGGDNTASAQIKNETPASRDTWNLLFAAKDVSRIGRGRNFTVVPGSYLGLRRVKSDVLHARENLDRLKYRGYKENKSGAIRGRRSLIDTYSADNESGGYNSEISKIFQTIPPKKVKADQAVGNFFIKAESVDYLGYYSKGEQQIQTYLLERSVKIIDNLQTLLTRESANHHKTELWNHYFLSPYNNNEWPVPFRKSLIDDLPATSFNANQIGAISGMPSPNSSTKIKKRPTNSISPLIFNLFSTATSSLTCPGNISDTTHKTDNGNRFVFPPDLAPNLKNMTNDENFIEILSTMNLTDITEVDGRLKAVLRRIDGPDVMNQINRQLNSRFAGFIKYYCYGIEKFTIIPNPEYGYHLMIIYQLNSSSVQADRWKICSALKDFDNSYDVGQARIISKHVIDIVNIFCHFILSNI
ncbi:unnamed protein product [Gordionus sp. m RMFG-2023]|uniref:uncharacterized protein LOC135928846 n=1 Tax=Gordionus sp. m RMFG-2023 TaxID=3053472 RepID=UPI0030E29186